MKTIIAGSRNIFVYKYIEGIISSCPWEITEVVSGDGGGVDFFGAYWGYLHNLKVSHFPARWEYLGKRAGTARNQVMVDNADALVYVWDGMSPGTKDVIGRAHRAGLQLHPQKWSPNLLLDLRRPYHTSLRS